jgi:hypothetical protein
MLAKKYPNADKLLDKKNEWDPELIRSAFDGWIWIKKIIFKFFKFF